MKITKWRAAGLALVAAALVAAVGLSTASAKVHATNLVIWTDANRAPAVTQLANAWASANGATVKVVSEGLRLDPRRASARSPRPTPPTSSSPPTTGPASSPPTASSSRCIRRRAVKAQFPKYTLDAFSYGTADQEALRHPGAGREHRAAREHEARPRSRRRSRSSRRRRWRSRRRTRSPSASASSRAPAATRTTCTRSSRASAATCSATNRAGNLDPSDIGLDNPVFLKNAKLIDKWNKEGLINSKIDYSTCNNAFLKGQAPYWLTGPWAVGDIQKAGVKFRVIQVPPIAKASVPFLGVNGHDGHEVRRDARRRARAATDLVVNYFSTAGRADAARRRRRPGSGEHQGEGDRPDPGPVRRGQQGRRPDAEHPADGERLERPRPGVGPLDEGRGRDAGARAPSRAPPARSRRRSASRRSTAERAPARAPRSAFDSR